MGSKIHHYTDIEIRRYQRFWYFLYKKQYPYYSDDEIMYLITRYRCPPWRWPAPMFYRGVLNQMERERIKAEREEEITIDKAEQLRRARKSIKELERVQKKIDEPERDPRRWIYRVAVTERRKGRIKVRR